MLTLISPHETLLHRVSAGYKLATLPLAAILVFQLESPSALLAVLAVAAGIYAGLGRAFFRQGLSMLRALLPFVVIVTAWHSWTADIEGGVVVILRMIITVSLANLVTMTSRLSDIIDTVERVASPLSRIGINTKALSIAIALTIRFIPVLAQKIELITYAWRARSGRRPGWRIFIPVMLSVLDDANHVADALGARGGATSPTN